MPKIELNVLFISLLVALGIYLIYSAAGTQMLGEDEGRKDRKSVV